MSAIEIKDNDGIRWLTLNRPDKMNALTVESLIELGEAFDAASVDDNVRCLVITGNPFVERIFQNNICGVLNGTP